MPVTPRAYAGGKFALELDLANAGWLHSAEGGTISADVVTEKLGTDGIAKKHLAGPKIDDISLAFGTGMSKAVYGWMKDSFDHKYSRTNGAIVVTDYDYTEIQRMTWERALISEIGLPALDAGSKDAAKFSLKYTPESVKYALAKGGKIVGKQSNDTSKQKRWLPSNFSLRIDGISDDDMKGVNKVDALVIKQKNTVNAVGEMRFPAIEPAYLEIPNVSFTIAESHAKSFYDWHQQFVINGLNTEDMEKGGALNFLGSDSKTVLFTVTFSQMGIFKITPDKSEGHAEGIRRVKVEMYCEEMKFDYPGVATWA